MNDSKSTFYIAPIGTSPEQVSKYESASPWADYSVGFNIQNVEYPVYHTHEYYEILVVLSGAVIHNINGVQYLMQSGNCCFIRPEDRHSILTPDEEPAQNDFLSVNFVFKKEFYNKVISVYRSSPLQSYVENKSPLRFSVSSSFLNSIQETCLLIQTPLNNPNPENVTICEALISELVHACVRIQQFQSRFNYPDWFHGLVLAMQNPDNYSKSLKELVKDIPYSYSYIQQKFKRLTGSTLVVSFTSLKLTHAKSLLASTKMNVSDIAATLGFDSTSHFNHLFKDSYKMSPTQYRKETNANS